MMRSRRQRGEGQFGCLVGLVILLLAGLIAYRMIPVKIRAAEMRDAVQDEAKSAGQYGADRIEKSLIAKAEQLQLPVDEKDVNVTKKAGYVTIDVEYTVPVPFPGFTYNWHFHHHAENPIF
jgi:hypothetical protein